MWQNTIVTAHTPCTGAIIYYMFVYEIGAQLFSYAPHAQDFGKRSAAAFHMHADGSKMREIEICHLFHIRIKDDSFYVFFLCTISRYMPY